MPAVGWPRADSVYRACLSLSPKVNEFENSFSFFVTSAAPSGSTALHCFFRDFVIYPEFAGKAKTADVQNEGFRLFLP